MELSIIILTCNEMGKLRICLNSIRHYNDIPSTEIIVIDNASKDGTLQMLTSDFSDVKVITNSQNRGVAPARNQGLRICKGKYILFLDNDTIMIEKSLSKMIDFMKSDNDVGLLGPKLINSDGSLQLSCRRFPTFFQPFASRVKILRKIAYFRNLLPWHLMEEFDHNSIVEVDYVLGACYLIQRRVFETVKFFDNKFFFGPDDCDYALRIWQNGFKVVYFPFVSIVHQHRRRTTKMGLMVIKHMIAMLYFFWKHKYLFRPAIPPRSIIG